MTYRDYYLSPAVTCRLDQNQRLLGSAGRKALRLPVTPCSQKERWIWRRRSSLAELLTIRSVSHLCLLAPYLHRVGNQLERELASLPYNPAEGSSDVVPESPSPERPTPATEQQMSPTCLQTSVAAMSSQEAGLSPVIPVIPCTRLAWKMRQNESGLGPFNPQYGPSDGKEEFKSAESEYAALQQAFKYIRKAKKKEATLEKHLQTVEDIAWTSGLGPEDIDTLLEVVLSSPLRGDTVKSRMLKCLIPTTLIPECAVVKAFSKLCTQNYSNSIKVIFFRWLIAMFDFIDHKEEINSLYGFFFSFLQEESMSCYICHLLYLLTKKENVKPFRVRRLLDFQSKVGIQPHLQALLSLYKSFCPDLITISLPQNRKYYFKNTDNIWQAAICIVKQRNRLPELPSMKLSFGISASQPQKKKWNSGCIIPMPTSSYTGKKEQGKGGSASLDVIQKVFPIEQLLMFSHLLENIQDIQLPSQICSVLKNSPLLHYLNCVRDETVWLRLYYWMSQVLKEGCTWYKVSDYTTEEEFKSFLDVVGKAQCFLQEGFPSSEMFLYRSLPLWDGTSCRSEYLQLLSWLPLGNFSEIRTLLRDSLAPLFFTSSIFHKCSVLFSLKQLLQNWLLGYAMKVNVKTMMSTSSDITLKVVDSVNELVSFVGWLSTNALRLEENNSFMFHFILDFFETVSDIYLNYNLPLVVIFPRGVFYPALLTLDSVTLNHLCYIMYRYRVNLTAAKENDVIREERQKFNKTYRKFNDYVTALVDCLWTSTSFEKGHFLYIDPEIMEKTKIKDYKKSFNLTNHPALLVYSIYFLLQGWPGEKELALGTIQKKKWNWYLDYLLLEDLHGLHLFMESSLNVADSASSASSYPDAKRPKICTSGPISV
ncbi:centromere protein I [Gracilinanus agilis]|uniref:centromere protein I n=1 Tax=Gracilinanus agilis TaxID=191870 RepID=UPI001CFECD6D|nr:centromere protein I [Gracilinanus agilis]